MSAREQIAILFARVADLQLQVTELAHLVSAVVEEAVVPPIKQEQRQGGEQATPSGIGFLGVKSEAKEEGVTVADIW